MQHNTPRLLPAANNAAVEEEKGDAQTACILGVLT